MNDQRSKFKDQIREPKKNNTLFKVGSTLCAVVLIFAFCTLNSSVVRAQSLSLSISPPLLEVMIKPGKSITQVFKLTNEGEPVFVTPRIVEYTENGIRGNRDFVRDSWINFLPGGISLDEPFLLHSGQTRGFILRINPPPGIPEKNYYRVLLFETRPNPPSSSFSQNVIQSRIGSILLLNVTSTGVTTKEAKITRMLVPRFIDSFDLLNIVIEVKNTGNTYFRPLGEISLTGPIGKGTYTIQPYVWLSGQSKILAVSQTSEQNEDNFTLHLPGFYIGKYEIGVQFTLDESTIRITDKKTFYAFPWKITLGLFFILIFVIMIKRRRKKQKSSI